MAEYKPALKTLGEFNKSSDKKQTDEKPALSVRDLFKKPQIEPTAEKAAEPVSKEKITGNKDSKKSNKSISLAVKESAKLRKNMLLVVKQLKSFQDMFAAIGKILSSDAKAEAKIVKINAIISSGGDQFKLAESEMEEKATIGGAITGVTDSIANAVPGVAAFALALPLLMSPEIRSMIMSFFTGFLEGLGVSKDVIENAGTYIKIALGALTAVFAYKALSPVVEVFNKMQELAKVLGIAGEAVNNKKTEVDLDKEKIDGEKKQVKDAQKKAKQEIKNSKSDLKKGRKMSILKKPGFLIKKLAPKLLSLVKNFVKALPIVGTVLGIGLVLYDLFDIGRDIYNFFFDKDEGDAEAENNVEEAQADQVQEEAPAMAATEAPSEGPAKKEEAPPAAATPSSSSSAPTSTEKPAAANSPSPSTPVAPAAPAAIVQKLSEEVVAKESDIKQYGGASIVMVDNSSTTIGVTDGDQQPSPNLPYSVSVGR